MTTTTRKSPERPCTRCGKKTQSKTQLCSTHRPRATRNRPERKCTGCGKRTVAAGGVCMTCRRPASEPEAVAVRPFDRLALEGGTWHYIAGVWRWIHWEAA